MNSQRVSNIQIGQIVTNKVFLMDEHGKEIPAGTRLQVVAVTPKVFHTRRSQILHDPERYDSKQDFLNLIREDDYARFAQGLGVFRVRCHFVTVAPVKSLTFNMI